MTPLVTRRYTVYIWLFVLPTVTVRYSPVTHVYDLFLHHVCCDALRLQCYHNALLVPAPFPDVNITLRCPGYRG